ncbi:protein kinase C iota type-like [Saccoglossus kowalevskii]
MPTSLNMGEEDHEIPIKAAYNGDILCCSVTPDIVIDDFCRDMRQICSFDDEQPFTMKWVDEEGDPCTISSQEELNEAIRLYDINKDSDITIHKQVYMVVIVATLEGMILHCHLCISPKRLGWKSLISTTTRCYP